MKKEVKELHFRWFTPYLRRICTGTFIALLLSVPAFSQGIRINGTVSDDTGPLSGVAIQIKGTTQGGVSNDNGEFSITIRSEADTLQFLLTGYQTTEVGIGQRRILAIVMKEETTELGEVTVVAFGIQRKESVIASVETVRVADLKQPSSNLTSAFAGRIPGLISYQTSGEPGADNAQFFIRGVTTFGYKTDPLILIDGFEASADDLARLQPDDIESFSILKDASATVLYGARGANGIITITTKSGKEGNTKVSARIDVNIATPTKMLELLDGVEYMKLYNQARLSRNPELGKYYNEQQIQATEQGINPMLYPNINWYDAMFNDGVINEKANINVSGGGKVVTYYVAGGFDHEMGLLKVSQLNNFNNNIDIKRFHIRSNAIIKLTSTTTLDTRIQGRFQKYFGPIQSANDVYKMVMDANPVDFPPVYAPDPEHELSKHILFGNTFLGTGLKRNPYAEMVRGYKESDESTISAQATLLQDLDFVAKGLKFQIKASVSTWNTHSGTRQYTPFYYGLESYNPITGAYTLYNLNPGQGQTHLGNVLPERNGNTRYYFEARLNWNRQFGKHNVGVMTVGMAEENILTTGASTDIYETLPERNLGNSGRVTYDYDTRYFLEFSYGYNGSEKFTGKQQFGFFPSIGAGWLVSNEKFWEPLKNVVSLLKLKYTWGQVGNDAITQKRAGRFFFLSKINQGGGAYWWGTTFSNSYAGYSVDRYANADITWEISTKRNFGLELGFLPDEAFKLQIDLFDDLRDNIYWPRSNYPATAGFEKNPEGNVGKVYSKGIDGSIDIKHSFNRDLWMTGRANFTYATNEVLEKDEPNYPYDYLKEVGHHTNQPRGFIAERLFVDEAEIEHSPSQTAFGTYMAGDIKYLDVNKDGVINDNDRVPMGYPIVPEIQYGFGLSCGYRNFDISFFFQGNARVSFFIDPASYNDRGELQGIAPFINRRNAPAIVARGAWSETNPDVHAFWPRLATEDIKNNTRSSSWWLRESSFIRLKSLEMGYNLPGINKIYLQNARVYLTCENLFYLSSFKLWDPEVGGNGLGYPLNRRFNIGLLLNF
jgi:TonB-linked SusC/RagA family outer membrane protein